MHRVWVKDLRKDEEDDQVVIFNIIQKSPSIRVHLRVDEAVEGCTGFKKNLNASKNLLSIHFLSGEKMSKY